jgi:glycosyltransferase involved in cell wall biosynthesis
VRPGERNVKVSVVVKAYNHAAYIRQTIQSVLDQSFRDFELLITDDGSTDDTVAIAEGFTDPRIHLQALAENMGISAAMNATISIASGEYVAILNSDDWALPHRLERQVAFLDEHPDIAAVFTLPATVNEAGTPCSSFFDFSSVLDLPEFSRTTLLRRFFFHGNCLCAPTAMIRRDAYTQVGPYDPRLTNLQDFDMWVRFLSMGFNIHVLAEKLTAFRIRDANQNMSAPRQDTKLRTQFETLQILRRFAALEPETFRRTFERELGDPRFEGIGSQEEAVALMAVELPDSAHRLFGLQTLFDIAASPGDFERLRQLAGATDIFDRTTEEHYSDLIKVLQQELLKQNARSQRLIDVISGISDVQTESFAPGLLSNNENFDLLRLFDEAFYLANNSDVAAAVRTGKIQSGYSHWITHGIRERRNFRVRTALPNAANTD